jgi:glycosyltransferase involved in cell wall biosynthesis
MRIAIISTPFIRVPPAGYGGTELFCHELCEELVARGHDVTLFATGDSVTKARKRWLYLRPEWPPSPADELNHAAWALGEVQKGGFDVVQLNSPLGLPFTRWIDAPAVLTLHLHREEPTSRLLTTHPQVTFVAISRRQLDLEVSLPRSTVIHHGLSPERYPPSAESHGYLLHLGRYAPEKGTHLALDAAAAAELPIKLAGRIHPPDRAYFEEQIIPRLAWPTVEEVGEVGHDRKVALLRGARALVAPLEWEEPFGLAAIEAMLCGTPVIGFPRGSFTEIIDEGVTGFLAPDGDVEAIARLARKLERFDRLGCARRARARFSAKTMVNAYEALYARLAKARFYARPRAA